MRTRTLLSLFVAMVPVVLAAACGSATSTGGGIDDGSRDASMSRDGGNVVRLEAGNPGDPEPMGRLEPPSCGDAGGPGLSNCGVAGNENESCCASPLVRGGAFIRSYDAVDFKDGGNPASVSDFRLDKFEATVGRFRRFVAEAAAGWRPAPGAGIHTHINGGKGLLTESAGQELGWNSAWNASLGETKAAWSANLLSCDPAMRTWTDSPSANEERPIVCETWFEAVGFCIWDGGFLPSEAEWNYAASGGFEQRVFPWSVPANSSALNCSYARGRGCGDGTQKVGLLPNGYGRWGQADLIGNAWEWNLDFSNFVLPLPCDNCMSASPAPDRVLRGGSYVDPLGSSYSSGRQGIPPDKRHPNVTVRCARVP